MSPTPALLCDRKQHVSQPSLWYRTSGAVSPHHKNLSSIQRKATVMCLLLCLHDCYTFRHPCNIHTYAQLHIHKHITMVMCDYKVKLKTEQEWIFLWFLSEYPCTYIHIYAVSCEWKCAPWSSYWWWRCLAQILHFACVVPPITAPDDNSRPHLKKALVRGFYAWGQIQAQVVAYEKLIMMPKKVLVSFSTIFCERNKHTALSLPRLWKP